LNHFVKNFLVSSKPFPPELVSASFKLKASLLGGTDDRLTRAQAERFTGLLRVGKEVTTALIPLLKARKKTPDGATLLALSEEIADGARRIAEALAEVPGAKRSISAEDLKSL